jgi:hypothetical protein
LLRSWARTTAVRQHTFFFTDAAEHDPALLRMSGGASHWIDTGCGAARGRALCCKTDAELRGFVAWADARGPRRPASPPAQQGSRWWCHLDDDNYVLLGPLRQFLSELRQAESMPYYVGRAGPTKSGNRLHAPFAMGTLRNETNNRTLQLPGTANCIIIDHFLHLNRDWSPRFSRCVIKTAGFEPQRPEI